MLAADGGDGFMDAIREFFSAEFDISGAGPYNLILVALVVGVIKHEVIGEFVLRLMFGAGNLLLAVGWLVVVVLCTPFNFAGQLFRGERWDNIEPEQPPTIFDPTTSSVRSSRALSYVTLIACFVACAYSLDTIANDSSTKETIRALRAAMLAIH